MFEPGTATWAGDAIDLTASASDGFFTAGDIEWLGDAAFLYAIGIDGVFIPEFIGDVPSGVLVTDGYEGRRHTAGYKAGLSTTGYETRRRVEGYHAVLA